VYRRRRPERTVLYRVMQQNLETWLARRKAAEVESGGVPAWVEGELRRYLECGILAHGFARARCAQCGHGFVVAFSVVVARCVSYGRFPARIGPLAGVETVVVRGTRYRVRKI
jgi:hypothetical protein